VCNNIITLSRYKINKTTAFNSQNLVPSISMLLALNRLAHSHNTLCTLNDHRVRDDIKLLLLPFIDVLISLLWRREGGVKRQNSECLCFSWERHRLALRHFFQHSNHQRKGVLRTLSFIYDAQKGTVVSKLLPALSFQDADSFSEIKTMELLAALSRNKPE